MSAIPAGLAAQVANGTAPVTWANGVTTWLAFLAAAPCAKVRRTTTTSIPDSTPTAVGFGVEDYDLDALHSITTNTSRLTIPTASHAGLWHIEGNVEWASAGAAGQYRTCSIWKNGTASGSLEAGVYDQLPTAMTFRQHVSVDLRLVAGDYVELVVFQNSGGALNVAGSTDGPSWFSARWIGL